MPKTLSGLASTARHLFAPSTPKGETPAQAKSGRSHGLSGLLCGLTSRAKRGGAKVHPEPAMSMAPRADLPSALGRQDSPSQPSTRPQVAPQGASHRRAQLPSQRSVQPDVLAERNQTAPPLAPLAEHLPTPSALLRPTASGAQNADPNIGRPSSHAALKKNLPSFVERFSADRALGPKQLVEALVGLSKGTLFEAAVNQEVGRNPEWGQQMQQRWNLLRNSIADARDGGDTQVPSLQAMVTDRRARFIKFMATGDERSLARLMRPQVPAAAVQTPPPTPTRTSSPQGQVPGPGAGASPAPGACAQLPPKQDVQAFAESYKLGQMDRDFSPKQLVEAMRALTTGTPFEGAFKTKVETNPQWGRKMQQNWQALRQELEARHKAGDPGVPSLNQIVGNEAGRTDFIKFLGTGKHMERLLPPRPQAAQAPQGLPEAHPQASLASQLKVLDQRIADSEAKGKEILHRMFNAPTGPEREAATRESYTHKAPHAELVVSRRQVQAKLERAGADSAAGQLSVRLKEVDAEIAKLKEGTALLNQIIAHAPSRREQLDAKDQKNSLGPVWKALTAQRAGMQAELERLRPEFQEARELGKALAELAQAQGPAHGHFAIQGPFPLHGKETIETNFERMAESRHLMGKGPELHAAQQQLTGLLQSGKLEGMPPNEAKELGKLAQMDVGAQFEKLADLKEVVDRTRANLRAVGAGGLFEGIRTTPSQRKADLDAERDSHQDALNEGYR